MKPKNTKLKICVKFDKFGKEHFKLRITSSKHGFKIVNKEKAKERAKVKNTTNKERNHPKEFHIACHVSYGVGEG